MNPLITIDQPEFAPSTLAELEDCSEDDVYAPGSIQPYGLVLVLQEPSLTILQVSQNVERFFQVSATALLGQPLQQLFSHAQVKQIATLLAQDNLEFWNPFELKARPKVPHSQALQPVSPLPQSPMRPQTFRSTLHRTAGVLILELEVECPVDKIHSAQFYYRLQSAILSLRGTSSVAELAHTLAHKVKAITGFDRVMVYRFESDEHGIVIAEEKEPHLESYLGLHYPATDVPAPARRLFLRNWVRQIPDVQYTPVPLVPATHPLTQTALDLSDCVLRGVHPAHVEYLQNMGVVGSLTISLIDDKRLWGLIACHHYSPKLVDYETRKTCEFLGQFASIELVHQQERELTRYREQVRAIQARLQQAFLREPNFIHQALTHNATQLLDLVHAEGVAIVLDQQISLIGQTPPLANVQALLSWISTQPQREVYLSNCLTRQYPASRVFKDVASGILAISILLNHKSYHLIWFRPEQIQTVHWAGDPRTTVEVAPGGALHLTPRKSFELWQETVQEMALPWTPSEIEAALMMRNTLMLAVLEFSQAALEQAAERAVIANHAKSQFLAKMSHELRTPLTAILGFTEIISSSHTVSPEFQEYLGIISRSGEHLLTLINDVLEMSRIEAGQLVLTDSFFNLYQLLRSLQEMLTLKAAKKGLSLVFETDPNLPRYLCSDEAKLRQILINLLGNAIKFTTQGTVTLRSKATAIEPSESACTCYTNGSVTCYPLLLTFEVEDTGCGIDRRDWESIFEAFMQTEQGRHSQGTGLGLSISRQFARLMGGDITIQSTVNQGSTFTCTIMARLPSTLDLVEPETVYPIIGLEPGQATYRILVAEDVLENRQLLRTLLSSVGFAVRVVENGLKAIAEWKLWHPHLILMDIQMPVMDGYEATREIRLQERDRGDRGYREDAPTKIIALTAYAFDQDRTASLQAGCDDYMAKPFTEAALFEMIARYLHVQYRYAEQPIAPASEASTLSKQDLALMPPEWIAQVHEAALDLNDDKIRQLIAQIPPQAQSLIQTMTTMVDRFQLEAIVHLTQT